MKTMDMGIKEIREALIARKMTCEQLIQKYIEHIQVEDREIAAYLYVNNKKAIEKAKEIDAKIAMGKEVGVLAGIPMALKDNICTKDMPTTCGSKMLENYCSPYNATVVERLEQEDAIILGKVNLDEFAMGSTTENSYYQSTKNPMNPTRVPGGSSGGSAAVVASKQAVFSLGSDTGGSIRQPASFCGVVGLKPSYGLISRLGLIAFASSLDQIGPITKSVEDMTEVLNVIAGYDANDSTSVVQAGIDYRTALGQSVKGLKVALPKSYLQEGVSQEVQESIQKVKIDFEKMGALVEEVDITSVEHALPAYYIISSAEASSNLARFDGIEYGYQTQEECTLDEMYKKTRSKAFGKEVKRRILLGTYALSSGYYDAYYKKAQQVRGIIKREFDNLFQTYDVIITPTAPTTAYALGSKYENPIEMYMGDIFTVPVNIAGLPALSINCGFDKDNMPIGLQIVGKAFDEYSVLKTAHAYESYRKGVI